MKKLESKRSILCWISVAVAALGLIAFLLLPMISVKPSDFGADFDVIKVEMSVFDINSGLGTLRSELFEEVGDGLDNLDEWIEDELRNSSDFDNAKEPEIKTMVKLTKRFLNFPKVFILFIIIAILGMMAALVFSMLTALKVEHKHLRPWMISVGGGLHLLSWVGLIFWVVKWFYDFVAVALKVIELEYPDITTAKELMSKMMEEADLSGSLSGMVISVIGVGFVLSILCAIVVVVLGILITKTVPLTTAEVNPDYGADDLYGDANGEWGSTANAETVALEGRIVGCSGEYAGCEIGIMPGETINIGRSQTQCQLIVAGPKISRKHCSITYDGEKNCYIVTDSSANGTYYMDGRRFPFEMPTMVSAGTEIYLGKKDFIFRLG